MRGLGFDIVRSVADLRARVSAWRAGRHTVALVPTMGALHEGHLSLVRQALQVADRVIVTLFVNPTQFAPGEDYEVYPRDEARDAQLVESLGGHLLFAPAVEEMYPPGALTRVTVPGLGDILEGEHRPGFFTGVATVVTKLLLQAAPDVALFGEKDYQQLQVIKRLARDLDIPVTILGSPTVREADGLALSSRNAYLSSAERAVAPALARVLHSVASRVLEGADMAIETTGGISALIDAGFDSVDYLTVRDAETLAPWPGVFRPGRALGAARLGRTRLIDNVPVGRSR